jgi:arylsulfatase A-like enzyme
MTAQTIHRRDFLKGTIAAAGGLAIPGFVGSVTLAADASKPVKPNIVFVFSDDHSLQAIGAYGWRLSEFCKKHGVTPNIDRLADQGGLFTNSFCCNSLCSPSRAAILTGLHSHANGVAVLDRPIKPGLWTFQTSLRQAGYATAVIGKWHLATTLPEMDYWRILPGQGAYENPVFIGPNGREKIEGYASDVITDLALDWLEKRDKTKPFFLGVHHKAPHRNWIPPKRYATWLDDVEIPEPDTLFDDYTNRSSPIRNQAMMIDKDMTLPSDLKTSPEDKIAADSRYAARNADFAKNKPQGKDLVRWKYQQYMKDYLRCIKSVDDSMGRVMDALKAAGLEDNTVVIYASDQGFYNGEHGWFDKRWILEESLHMPFIIRWPGVVKPGTRMADFVQNIDYAPTFTEIAGGVIPDGLHGRSFVPILRGRTPADWRTSVYYQYYDSGHGVAPHYGIRTRRYTLAHYLRTDEWDLYDLEKDPRQMRSVASDPAYADTLAELKKELQRLQAIYQSDPKKTMNEGDL